MTTSLAINARPMDPTTTLKQIGSMTVLAISGGRVTVESEGGIILPVSNGYSVRITLAANDTYTVERIFRRGTKVTLRTVDNVYCDELSDVAYYASCFRSHPDFGTKVIL